MKSMQGWVLLLVFLFPGIQRGYAQTGVDTGEGDDAEVGIDLGHELQSPTRINGAQWKG